MSIFLLTCTHANVELMFSNYLVIKFGISHTSTIIIYYDKLNLYTQSLSELVKEFGSFLLNYSFINTHNLQTKIMLACRVPVLSCSQ